MLSKTRLVYPKFYISCILIFGCLFFSSRTIAQCAGTDNIITICDIPNPSSQTIDLFGLLGSSAVAGGTWSDDNLSGGLNTSTGILNVQLIPESKVYNYTYTTTGCIDNSSTVTVTVGGYAGISGPNASVCSDEGSFNLFQLFDGNYLSPQFNGSWSDDDASGFVSGNFLNVEAALGNLQQRTLRFTYTMPAIGSCLATSAVQGSVTIYRAPKPGIPTDLLLCNSEYLNFNTNLDLNSLLAGEDTGGRWTESRTSELSSIPDRFVNVRNIYDTLGVGMYSFSYTVFPQNPACTPKTSLVNIIIEKQLDFTNATLVVNSDICEDAIASTSFSATLTQGTQAMVDGAYSITYTVSGPNGETKTILANFVGGVLNFPLSANSFKQAGNFTVAITNVSKVGELGACTPIINNLKDVLTISALPNIDNAVLTINPVCKDADSLVQMSGMSNLSDGTYQIFYNLSGQNLATNQTATLVVAGGVSNFTIQTNLIPKSGKTTITITSITNLSTNCINTANKAKEFEIKPLPIVANMLVGVKDTCLNQPVSVALSGLGSFTNVSINYTLSGSNIATSQTIMLTVTNGSATFDIPQALLTTDGATTVSITNLTDNGSLCTVAVSNVTAVFTIYPLLTLPTAVDQVFCKTDKATIANLLPKGSQYQWFDSPTSTTPLLNNKVLESGNYYLKEINPTTKCESPKKAIVVIVYEFLPPILNTEGQNFCGLDKPTLQELSDRTSAPATTVWFDAPANGTILPNTTLLKDGVTYYGFYYSSNINCYSENKLEVLVSLSKCDEIVKYDFFIPDGFSPNDDGVNDVYQIPKIEFLFPNYSYEIYNRYGGLMFQGNRNKPSWDGKSSESKSVIDGLAPNGVYFYIINFNKDNKLPLQGRLYLNR